MSQILYLLTYSVDFPVCSSPPIQKQAINVFEDQCFILQIHKNLAAIPKYTYIFGMHACVHMCVCVGVCIQLLKSSSKTDVQRYILFLFWSLFFLPFYTLLHKQKGVNPAYIMPSFTLTKTRIKRHMKLHSLKSGANNSVMDFQPALTFTYYFFIMSTFLKF